MSDYAKAVLFVTITNVMKIIIFAWLAVYFDKWGIVLLSALFMTGCSSESTDDKSQEDQTNG